MSTDGDRERLDEAMKERRKELRIQWNRVAELAGMTYGNLHKIRTGQIAISEDAAYGLEIALQWTHGSIDAVLAGGTPTKIDEAKHADEPADLRDDTERRLWALADLPEDERWALIYTHRAEQAQRAAKRERSA